MRKDSQKFIFRLSFMAKLLDQSPSLLQEVSHHILITPSLYRDAQDGRERSHLNRSLEESYA
jgi:hypothetical protein